jgi:hypothetical protein
MINPLEVIIKLGGQGFYLSRNDSTGEWICHIMINTRGDGPEGIGPTAQSATEDAIRKLKRL